MSELFISPVKLLFIRVRLNAVKFALPTLQTMSGAHFRLVALRFVSRAPMFPLTSLATIPHGSASGTNFEIKFVRVLP